MGLLEDLDKKRHELRPGITVGIAAHPTRLKSGFLMRALDSACSQTLQPEAIVVVNDKERLGAGFNRRTILNQVSTRWLAWLDSDDAWYRNHLQDLYTVAEETDSVYVYSWFDAVHDPLGHFGKVFDPCNPHHTTTVALIDTAIAQHIGYRDSLKDGPYSEEDWGFISSFAAFCCEHGLKMTHLPKRTWHWEQGPQNTSGLPGRGDNL
jgi:hypothetical protein